MYTFANPLNISYRLQMKGDDGFLLREAADPSVVWFQHRFWLFPSKSNGFWHSRDLSHWQFCTSKILPTEDYADYAMNILFPERTATCGTAAQ